MISNSVFVTVTIAVVLGFVSAMAVITQVLGARITDVANMLGGRIGGLDTRLNALEGAVRDMGERLTRLETDLGK